MTKPISPSSHDHASGNQPRLRMYAGGTTGEMAKRFAEIERNVEEAEAKRAQRRKELHEKNIAADVRVVAWIDILGFSNQLQHARTEPEYRAVYHRMLRVQDAFDVPSASDEPDKREDINAAYGRTVLALSDGLVVAASPKAKMRESMTPYDLLMSLVGQIVMAQAHCAMRGIFLRGGISIGPFYYENNILLSPALIRAYKLETERAGYPVIIVTQEDIATLRALPGIECYAKGFEPSLGYFLPFKAPGQKKGERFFHLDYLNFLANPNNYFFYCEKDRKDSSNRKKSPAERQRIFDMSHDKSAARAMWWHKHELLKAYRAAKSERAKAKYRWLMAYQNRALRGLPTVYNKARISLKEMGKA